MSANLPCTKCKEFRLKQCVKVGMFALAFIQAAFEGSSLDCSDYDPNDSRQRLEAA